MSFFLLFQLAAVALGSPNSDCEEADATCAEGDVPDDDDFDESEIIVVTGLGLEEDLDKAVHHTRVIAGDEMRATGAQSVADALETQAGVQIVDTVGGEGIRLQGLDPEHTLILIDGVRVSGRVGGTLDLRRIPASDVEQVEIVEGPSATLYGSDAVAGVVHIRTRRGKAGVQSELSVSTGRFLAEARDVDEDVDSALPIDGLDSLDAAASLSAGTEDLTGRLQASFSAAEATTADPESVATALNAYRQSRVSGSADWKMSTRTRWEAQGQWQSFRRWGVDALPTGAVLDRTNLTAEWGASVGPTIELSDTQRLQVVVGARGWVDQLRVDQRGSDAQDTYQRTSDLLGQVRVRYDTLVGDRHALVVGAEGLGERLTADRIDPKTVGRTRAAAFVQDRWDVLGDDQLLVDAALRGDYDSLFGTYFTPRAGLRWIPDDRVLFRVSGGRGFRAPDFRELYLVFENAASGYRVDGSPDLRPETSWNLQGGVELRPTGGTELAVRGFYNTLDDLIQADLLAPAAPGVPQRFGYVNIASVWTAGGELEASVQDADVGQLGVVYRLTETLDRETELPLSGRARHQVSTQAGLQLPIWDSSLQARSSWFGPRAFVRSVDGESVVSDAPAFVQIDLSLRIVPHERFDLVLGVENLANAGSTPEDLLQTRPRRGFLTLQGRLGRTPPAADAPTPEGEP